MIVAIGDRNAGDDAVGPLLVDRLKGAVSLPLLDCGSYPQNFLSVIARAHADAVILVDAAELGLAPGQVRVVDRSALHDWGGSHGMPMSLLLEQLEALTEASVLLLGIQVGALTPGPGISPAVEATLTSLACFLMKRYPRHAPEAD